jgi:hypothetical protein
LVAGLATCRIVGWGPRAYRTLNSAIEELRHSRGRLID